MLARLAWRSGPEVKKLVVSRKAGSGVVWSLPVFGAVVVAVSVVVFGFYVWKSNNYGGFTSGPRWLFWLVPLWLLGSLLGEPMARRDLRTALTNLKQQLEAEA